MLTIGGLVLLFGCVLGSYLASGGSMEPLIEAVPFEANCALPNTDAPVQDANAASQKFTCPGETGAPLDVTVAVSVTTVPLTTVLAEAVSAV